MLIIVNHFTKSEMLIFKYTLSSTLIYLFIVQPPFPGIPPLEFGK